MCLGACDGGRVCMCAGSGVGGQRERFSSGLPISVEPNLGMDLMTQEIMT